MPLYRYNTLPFTTLSAGQAASTFNTTGVYIPGPYSGPIANYSRNGAAIVGPPPLTSTLFVVAAPPATVPTPGPANVYGFATPPGSAVPISLGANQ